MPHLQLLHNFVAQAIKTRREQLRLRPHVNHELGPRRQGVFHGIPQSLGMIGPVGQNRPAVPLVVVGQARGARNDVRCRFVLAAAV